MAIEGFFLKSPETGSLFTVSCIEKTLTAEMSIHPQIIEKEGKKEFVVLPYEEFLQIQDTLESYDGLKILREEKVVSVSEPTRKLDDILAELGR